MVLCVAFAADANAQTYSEAVAAALKSDAAYAAALAGVSNRQIAAREAAASFYPSARLSYSQPSLGQGGSGVATVSVTQPIASYDRYLNFQQVEPINLQAQLQARQARSDLGLRVFRAMADAIRAREAIRTIDVQLQGLGEQLQRAQRMRELGQGTITEVSDFEVRLAVAQANRVNQETALQGALRVIGRITGLTAAPQSLDVADAVGGAMPLVGGESEFVSAVLDSSVPVQTARQAVRLQEIAARRVRAQYFPVLSASVSRRSDGASSGGVQFGLSLEAPLSAGSLYDDQRAANDLRQARDNLRLAEQTAASDALTLWRATINQAQEVEIRRRAVLVARQALEGNIRSYQGGVKSNIDVVTSYQNLADSENALVNSQLSLLESRLQQRLLLTVPDDVAR
jgi:protease secretion system outer membrane protein